MFFYLVQLIQTKSTKLQKVSQNIKQEEKNWLWSWWYVSSVFKWVPGVLLPHSPKQWLSYYFFFFFGNSPTIFNTTPKCTHQYVQWDTAFENAGYIPLNEFTWPPHIPLGSISFLAYSKNEDSVWTKGLSLHKKCKNFRISINKGISSIVK